MALAHNGIIRGLNAIYIQAPHIPQDAIKDFLTYCQCWCETMHHHHDGEEDNFFPNIEKITGVKGLMERNVQQHRAFTPGFEASQEYADKCRVEEHEGAKVRSLIEAFAEPLSQHLHEEIDTLRALDKYDSAKVRQAYKDLEKIEMAGDGVSHVPLSVLAGFADTVRSIETAHSSLAPPIEALKVERTIFRLCRSSSRISCTTCSRDGIVGPGDLTPALRGENAGNYRILARERGRDDRLLPAEAALSSNCHSSRFTRWVS